MGWNPGEEDVEHISLKGRTEGIEDPLDQPAFQRIDYDPTDGEVVEGAAAPSSGPLKSTLPAKVPPVVVPPVVVPLGTQGETPEEPRADEPPPWVVEQEDLVRGMPRKNNGRNKKSGGL